MGLLMKALEISWAKPMDMQCIFPFEGRMHLSMAGFASTGHLRGEAELRELLFESDVSAVGSVKQNLSGNSFLKFVMWLFHSLPLPHHAVGWSAVCVCGSSWSYSLTFKLTFSIQFFEVVQQEQQKFL